MSQVFFRDYHCLSPSCVEDMHHTKYYHLDVCKDPECRFDPHHLIKKDFRFCNLYEMCHYLYHSYCAKCEKCFQHKHCEACTDDPHHIQKCKCKNNLSESFRCPGTVDIACDKCKKCHSIYTKYRKYGTYDEFGSWANRLEPDMFYCE